MLTMDDKKVLAAFKHLWKAGYEQTIWRVLNEPSQYITSVIISGNMDGDIKVINKDKYNDDSD